MKNQIIMKMEKLMLINLIDEVKTDLSLKYQINKNLVSKFYSEELKKIVKVRFKELSV